MPYVEKRIKSGDLLEIERYHVTLGGRRTARGKKENPSNEAQQLLNDKNAAKKLTRLINANFSGRRGDMFLTFTHEDGTEEHIAFRRMRNFLDRLRRWWKKNRTGELRLIIIDEKQGQWHHHLIMPGVPLEALTALWGHGRVTASVLYPITNYAGLANYLMQHHKPPKGKPQQESVKQPRAPGQRRWSCSRNLRQPVVTVKEIKPLRLGTQPKAPRGYQLLNDWSLGCDYKGNLYQSFSCVKIHKPKERGKVA